MPDFQPFDAVMRSKAGKLYIFRGSRYFRYTPQKGCDSGYPAPMEAYWERLPADFCEGIDAAAWYPTEENYYFFKDSRYARYSPNDGMDHGYPKPIRGNWPGMPREFARGVDDAFFHPYERKFYFFKGSQYLRYEMGVGVVDGFPKPIAGHWHGLPAAFEEGFDAIEYVHRDRNAYIFKGDEYVRYTLGLGTDAGYPKKIAKMWDGFDRVYINDAEAEAIIREQLAGNIDPDDFNLYLQDTQYFCTPIDDAAAIIHKSSVSNYKWTEEVFDCDDFAFLLKGAFARDAYRNQRRRSAHCFGMVWGKLFDPESQETGWHAINWMINDDLQLRFIEPQTEEIYFPRREDKLIYFMAT